MISIILQISSYVNIVYHKTLNHFEFYIIQQYPGKTYYRSTSADSLVELYQPDGSYLNANHGEINYIYMINIYSLKQILNFYTII